MYIMNKGGSRMKIIKLWVNNYLSHEFENMLAEYIVDKEVESRNKIWYTVAYKTRCMPLEYMCNRFNLNKRIIEIL
jgi:hypothetical protein